MCSINHDKKALFIHIPKTGGSYIAEVLSKNYGFKNYYLQRYDHKAFCNGKDKSVDKHENKIHGTLMYYKTSKNINKIMGMTEEKWNTYFIFTFVRNPYDRIVSGWNYINRYNIPFNNYLDFHRIANSYDYWHVFMSQTRHLISNNGKIHKMGYIGKFEDMENDLQHILHQIGFNNITHIPFKKNSKSHNDYKTYYTHEEVLRKVNVLIKEDLENLDYSYYEL
jgi:chondroitin 4-sulfotransferase 11